LWAKEAVRTACYSWELVYSVTIMHYHPAIAVLKNAMQNATYVQHIQRFIPVIE
jgi:hypothetical protein